jgi:hypothetical protein
LSLKIMALHRWDPLHFLQISRHVFFSNHKPEEQTLSETDLSDCTENTLLDRPTLIEHLSVKNCMLSF